MDWTAYLTPSLGAAGLLAAVVIMVLTGRLQPKTSVDERLRDKDRQIEAWRSNFERGLDIQREQQRQISALLEASRTATRVIEALPKAAALKTGSDGEGA